MKTIRENKEKIIFLFLIEIFLMAFLLWRSKGFVNSEATSKTLAGNGTKEDPYRIGDELEFKQFAACVNNGEKFSMQYFQLESDLDFSQIQSTVGEENNNNTFAGFFDGNGHRIYQVDMVEDDYAGLFHNLSGTVCNLIVEGKIQAQYAGAIASSVYESARILNCQSKAEIIGENVNELAGEFSGTMDNCVASNAVIDVDEYNKNLDKLCTDTGYANWCKWEEVDGTIQLTQEKQEVVEYMETCVKDIILHAYSGMNGIWYFAIPSGCEQTEFLARIKMSGGASYNYSLILDEMKEITVGDRIYQLECVRAEGVPTIQIETTQEGSVEFLRQDKENYIDGNIIVYDEDMKTLYKGMVDELSGRGNHSWREVPKKGYSLTLKYGTDLLDMGYNEDYILVPGYRDNSLLSYKLVQDMEKELGIAYAPESRFVNLYIDSEYYGMYLLTEKIEIDNNRYEISDVAAKTQNIIPTKLSNFLQQSAAVDGVEEARVWYDIPVNPSDITGGYILELNNRDYDIDKSRFKTRNDMMLTLKSDKYATKEQVDYIADYWQDFEDAVFSEDGYNEKGKYYADYIDIESFVDQWLMYELNSEVAMTDSVFFYKESDVDGDGLLHAGYVWDVEHSFTSDDDHMYILDHQNYISNNYWGRLYGHSDFAQLVSKEWKEKFSQVVSKVLDDRVLSCQNSVCSLNYYQNTYAKAAYVNQTRWEKCNWENKVNQITDHLKKKSEFLDQWMENHIK